MGEQVNAMNQNRPSQFAPQNPNSGLVTQNMNMGIMQNQGTPHAHSEGYLETSPQTLINFNNQPLN